MSYDDLPDLIGKPAEPFFHLLHLSVIDAAAFDDESPGCIDTGNCDFIVQAERLQIICNVLLIDIEPAAEPGVNVVQRNIMISRHNDLRCWQRP